MAIHETRSHCILAEKQCSDTTLRKLATTISTKLRAYLLVDFSKNAR